MPKFRITVSRDTTERAIVEVVAPNMGAADLMALNQAGKDYGAHLTWEHDENSGVQSKPYTTNWEMIPDNENSDDQV